MPGRPRTGIGTFGSISTVASGSEAFTASTRVRDWDGQLRRVTARGTTKAKAVAALKAKLADRDQSGAAGETVTADMPFAELAQLWLEDIKIDPRLSDGTKAVYESELRTLVLPTFEHFALREISTARVERYLTAQSVKSYARAKHSKVILNLLMRFAQRHDAIRHNPVAGTSALRRPPVAPKALSMDELQAIRNAARTWRSGGVFPGPKPDGQLRDVIEVMLGTSARIGEALALRRCDVDMTANPPVVHICGTIVVRTGKGTSRQAWTKTSTSDRTVAIPQFAAEVIRKRLGAVDDREPEHLTAPRLRHTTRAGRSGRSSSMLGWQIAGSRHTPSARP